jgi:hypothetical protein
VVKKDECIYHIRPHASTNQITPHVTLSPAPGLIQGMNNKNCQQFPIDNKIKTIYSFAFLIGVPVKKLPGKMQKSVRISK